MRTFLRGCYASWVLKIKNHKTMKKVAIVCGGYDEERVLSFYSADHAEQALANGFKTYRMVLSNDAFSFHYETPNGSYPVDRSDFTFSDADGNRIRPDVILMLIHGEPGSSGALLGYFELLKIPFSCNKSLTASLLFNKRFTNLMAGALGVKVPKSLWIQQGDAIPTVEMLETIGYPAIVKPVNGGLSLGVSRILHYGELQPALALAFKEDHQVLIESFITGREIAVGVLRTSEGIQTLPCCEVRSVSGFLSHQDKSSPNRITKTIPALLSVSERQAVETIATKMYQQLECKGIIRVDFIVTENGVPVLLEINSVPGMAASSIIPETIKVLGWTMEYFFTQLIEMAS
jgi:D-alanine-D-alanine ligase